MAEAVQRERWNHTSQLLAMIVNVNRSSKSEPAKASDFHPFEERKKDDVMPNPLGIEALKILIR